MQASTVQLSLENAVFLAQEFDHVRCSRSSHPNSAATKRYNGITAAVYVNASSIQFETLRARPGVPLEGEGQVAHEGKDLSARLGVGLQVNATKRRRLLTEQECGANHPCWLL